MNFFETFSQLRPRIVSDKCCWSVRLWQNIYWQHTVPRTFFRLAISGYPSKNVTSENTELKQAMLKLNTTFMLQNFVLLHHRA